MSICSDIFITREEARKRVSDKLMYQQQKLVEAAVKSMKDYELTSELNNDGDGTYFYNISKEKKSGKPNS